MRPSGSRKTKRKARKGKHPVRVLLVLILLVLCAIAAFAVPDLLKERAKRIAIETDTVPPVIELVSNEGTFTLPGEPYAEEGYTATDNLEGDLTDRVVRTEADGAVTYTVSDTAGNETTVRRTIVYGDPVPPVITLAGDAAVTLNAGVYYTEPGFSAADNVDGDLTERVSVTGTVDPYQPGTYEISYAVTDSYGNAAAAKRTVTVLAPSPQKDDPEKGEKNVYLTFDDGPGPYTERLLDILARYNVKATFFVIDNPVYGDLIGREVREGHSVGIHTATHSYETIYASEEAFFADFQIVDDLIYEKGGIRTKISRFPGGSSNTISEFNPGIMTRLAAMVREKGFQYFDWNVASGDAGQTKSTYTVFTNVINGVKGKADSVVLQHDIHAYSVDAVERIIVWGLVNGYTFLPLDETSYAAHHRIFN